MKQTLKRGMAMLVALILCIGLLSAIPMTTDAAEFEYVYDSTGKYIYNWGTRGETATSLSPNAEAFYTDGYTYDELSAYAGGTGTSDAPSSELYKVLQAFMKSNHKYETSYGATRELYQYTDCQNSGLDSKVISSFYSGDSIGPAWDSGKTWNREHTWPDSKGLGGNDENDIMMLRPTAKSENGARGNKAYGESSGYYFPNSESNGAYDVRGDVARIFLYVYVRWGNVNGNGNYDTWGSRGVIESLDVLLKWMEEDPVDTWELGRNDSVESITGTRNVFVDYPELAFLLFGEEVPSDMTTPSGEAQNQDAPTACTHSSTTVKNAKAATCGANGYTGDTLCADCGAAISAGAVIPATGKHTLDSTGHCTGCDYYDAQKCTHSNTTVKNAKAATCGANGYTGDTICADCGEALSSGAVIPATGEHSMVPEESTPGDSMIKYHCEICGYEELITLPPCEHNNTELRDAKDATCGTDGYSGDTLCNDCGKMVEQGEAIPATGEHDLQVDFSYSGSGTKYRCQQCDYSIVEDWQTCTHENTEVRNRQDATCVTNGCTGDLVCLECGSVVEASVVIPATGEHTLDETGHCTGCDYTECAHKNVIHRNQKEATCSAEGHTGDVYCADCDAFIAGGSVIPATGEHSYGDDGKCTVCGQPQPAPETPDGQPKTENETLIWIFIIGGGIVVVAMNFFAIRFFKKSARH